MEVSSVDLQQKINSGEYDVEQLSEVEAAAIEEY